MNVSRPESESRLPLPLIVGLFNSKLLDWYFRLGSTNSKVNDYQVRILPVPFFSFQSRAKGLVQEFTESVEREELGDSIGLLSPYLEEPPFATEIMDCIVYLVKGICEMEASRGDIARTEGSALNVRARPYQKLIDAIIFRLAGLTDAEAEGLEQRLSKML